MLRKLKLFLISLLMVAQVPTAQALDLGSAFNNLMPNGGAVAVNSPGHYQSAARNSFIAGGLEMRFPRKDSSAQLFSFTPPKVTAGCNGISAFFGGFSFISGQEFEQLVKNIASGAALGFVTMLTLKTLCPQCADVVQQLKNAAQVAARLSIDSCRLGQNIAAKFKGEQTDFTGTLCGSTVSGEGMVKDFLEAANDKCKSIAGALDGLQEVNPGTKGTSDENKAQAAELACKVGSGNVTWATLGNSRLANDSGGYTYARRILIMNMMGAVLRAGNSDVWCETADGKRKEAGENEKDPNIFCAPTVAPKDIAGAFMCGTDATALNNLGSPTAIKYCTPFFENGSSANGTASLSGFNKTKLLVCNDDQKVCNQLSLKTLDEAGIVAGTGYLTYVQQMLRTAVQAVKNNEPLKPEVINLMELAPYPLYQAINAAAVYPVAASDLLDSISALVAEALTAATMEELIRVDDSMGGNRCTTEDQVKRILAVVAESRNANYAMRTLIAANLATQQGIKEQIRMVNLAIQRQVMSEELLHQNRVAQQLGSSRTPKGSSGPNVTAGTGN